MKLVQVNYAFDPGLATPEALLDTYHTLTGWSDAAASAGLAVNVVQAFACDGAVRRGAVHYRFRASGERPSIFVNGLHAAVAACEPDVVHVNGLDAPIRTWLLRRSLPAHVALVVQDHAGAPSRRFSLKAPIRRRAMRAADAYLFTSRHQASPWVDGGFIGGPSRVHDVLEASTAMRPVERAGARKASGIGGRPAVLWVGRLDANKDPLTVLAGFEQALAVMPDATLTMVYGENGLLPSVERRVTVSPLLRKSVRLAGAVPHDRLAAWYSAADLFVLGSWHEGSGYALLEACACGPLPVVTDIAPFRAITLDGAIGVHWPVGDAAALGRALVAAGSRDLEYERRVVLGHFARHLSWDAVGQRARTIYEAVCEERRGRGAR